jgi:hypothetical protein
MMVWNDEEKVYISHTLFQHILLVLFLTNHVAIITLAICDAHIGILVLVGLNVLDFFGAVDHALPIQIIAQPPHRWALFSVLLPPAEVCQLGLLWQVHLDPRGDVRAVGHVVHQEAHVRAAETPLSRPILVTPWSKQGLNKV